MSKLEELETELYGKDDEKIKKRLKSLKRESHLPRGRGNLLRRWFQRKKPVEEAPKPLVKTAAFKFFIGAMAIIIAVGTALWLFIFLGTRGREASITIYVDEKVESGELLNVPVSFKNNSSTVLHDVELVLILPHDSVIVDEGIEKPPPPRITLPLVDLESGEEGIKVFQIRLFGRVKEEKKIEVRLLYRPENLKARFSVSEIKTVVIDRVPLALFWDLPELLSDGQGVEFTLRYSSLADTSFKNMALRIEYPPGFNFISADPEPDIGTSIWLLGDLKPGTEGFLKIKGNISGEEGEIKTFRGELGVFNKITKDWRIYEDSRREVRIAASPLSVQVFLEDRRGGVVESGDRMKFTVVYKNNTAFPIRNISVRAVPEGKIFLLNTLSVSDNGVFDFQSQSIVWGPGNTPQLRELAPGESGEFRFSLGTRSNPPLRGEEDKNQRIGVRALISAASLPQELTGTDLRSEDQIMFKVRSKILFAGKAIWHSSPIPNSGPLPPRVGFKTTYTIIWEIRNFTNDLENVEITAPLPPNIEWEEKVSPTDADISFDEPSRVIRWRVGRVKAGTGILTPALSVAFQVSIVPSEADIKTSPVLIGESEFVGKDVFTQEIRRSRIDTISTALLNDPLSNFQEWEVVR